MHDYEEIMNQFVSQLSQKAISEQDIADPNVRGMADKLAELEQRVADAALDAGTKALLDELIGTRNTLAGFREEYLYIQGAKDCVGFLREIGVLL